MKTSDVTDLLRVALIRDGRDAVSAATGKPVPYLLLAVEMKASFNRAILRYLGLRCIGREQYAFDERLVKTRLRFFPNRSVAR